MPDAPQEDPALESLRAVSHYFVGGATLVETLDRVAELANEAIPSAEMVGLTMGVEGRATTTAATDPAVRAIDAAQYETGIGPCLDAYRHRAVYRISDTEKDETWRPFSEAAAARGIRSTLSLPLVANGEGVGALNFYSRCPGAFGQGGDDEERIASAFAAQAAVVLANAEAYWDARVLTEQLGFALETRATIEQAKGILMASGRTADDAFQLLVRASQRENRNLNAVAADIVAEAERRGSIQ